MLSVEHGYEKLVRAADRLLERLLHARPAEECVGGANQGRLESRRDRRGEGLRYGRQPLLERLADVDVLVELVDEVDGDRAPDGGVLDELRARVREVVRVQRLPLHPDVERGDEREHACQDDESPGNPAAPARRGGRRLARRRLRVGVGRACHVLTGQS